MIIADNSPATYDQVRKNYWIILYGTLLLFGGIAVVHSFWLYSRFTVDDAFITWRYGKNLIEHGVWSYNPTTFDLTQAYTNPIYALLSIVPAFFGVDVVFFFKIVATLTILIFSVWFLRITQMSWLMIILLLSIPATIVHAYSGLETFLFVALVSALFISLDKNQRFPAIILTWLLFLTRPESWLLVVLVPTFFAVEEPKQHSGFHVKELKQFILSIGFSFNRFFLFFIALAVPLILYFSFHEFYFGRPLPNTFYIKSGADFSSEKFIKGMFFISPLLMLIFMKRYKLFLVSGIFLLAICLNNSMSDLQMDYAERFTFHFFVPIYVIVTSSAMAEENRKLKLLPYVSFLDRIDVEITSKIVISVWMLCFLKMSGMTSAHMGTLTYYPRLLEAHAELGKTLADVGHKYDIDAFILADAGVAAFHSDLNALDNLGLGSAAVARDGVTTELMNQYGIDLIALLAQPDSIRFEFSHQQKVFDWSQEQDFVYLCRVYFTPYYILQVYAKSYIGEIEELCERSQKANDRPDEAFSVESMLNPPWMYWRG